MMMMITAYLYDRYHTLHPNMLFCFKWLVSRCLRSSSRCPYWKAQSCKYNQCNNVHWSYTHWPHPPCICEVFFQLRGQQSACCVQVMTWMTLRIAVKGFSVESTYELAIEVYCSCGRLLRKEIKSKCSSWKWRFSWLVLARANKQCHNVHRSKF